MARAYAQSGDLERALNDLKIAAQLKPDDALVHAALSQVQSALGNLQLAIVEQRQALKLNENDPDGWNNLGVLDARTGDIGGAREAFEHALKVAPDHAQARAILLGLVRSKASVTSVLCLREHDSVIPSFMSAFMTRSLVAILATSFLAALRVCAQQPPEAFHWVDFHSDADSDVVNWVCHSLDSQQWTVIREIGVEYDAALVITDQRKSKNAMPNTDTFSLWSVSLTTHATTLLVSGAKLRFVDWLRFTAGRAPEIALFYDDCEHCQATTFFTALHYDATSHEWVARWMRAGQAAPVWSSNTLADGSWTQLYGLFPKMDGSVALATWSHFDDTTHKPQSDFVYLYSVDVGSGIESRYYSRAKRLT